MLYYQTAIRRPSICSLILGFSMTSARWLYEIEWWKTEATTKYLQFKRIFTTRIHYPHLQILAKAVSDNVQYFIFQHLFTNWTSIGHYLTQIHIETSETCRTFKTRVYNNILCVLVCLCVFRTARTWYHQSQPCPNCSWHSAAGPRRMHLNRRALPGSAESLCE